mmetsp:Transcript_2522/g.3824  ORF Transcript_2522/g.3824 Transcript_2522/m.3824 type:complete len:227 (+) Transcript_2522:44-724(+)
MGAAASVQGQEQLTLDQAKELAGKHWDQEHWDSHSTDGVLHRNKFREIIRGADPEFVWSLYDRDNSGSIQVSELSKLILDLGMGEGDVDLDTAVAEMEIDDMDDNMDGKLGKAEFMKWLAAKKQELADMEPEPTKKSSKPEKVKHVAADQNAWGDDPKHHAAAIKIQSVARGRKTRHEKDSHEEGEIVVLDPGLEEAQTKAALKIQAQARGKLARKKVGANGGTEV